MLCARKKSECVTVRQGGRGEGGERTAMQERFINSHFQKTLCGLAPKSHSDIHHVPSWVFLRIFSGQVIVLGRF